MFFLAFGARVGQNIFAFGRKADTERRIGQHGDAAQDVGIFGQLDGGCGAALAFFQFLAGNLGGTVIGHGGHADKRIHAGFNVLHHGIVHFFRAFDRVDMADAHRQSSLHVGMDDIHFRPGHAAGTCQSCTHLPAGTVGDAAHGVDGFVARAHGEQHFFAIQRLGRPEIRQQFSNFFRFAHSADAGFAACLFADGREKDVDTVALQLLDVTQIGRIVPHFDIHGGGDGQRAFACRRHFGNQVVGKAVRDFGNGVGGGGGNQHDIGRARGLNVGHAVACAAVLREHGVAAQCLHGLRRDEVAGCFRHGNGNGVPLFFEQAHDFAGFVGGNSAGNGK